MVKPDEKVLLTAGTSGSAHARWVSRERQTAATTANRRTENLRPSGMRA